MAFALLNPLAAPWQHLGLRYLLAPADLPPELSLCGSSSETAAPAPSGTRSAPVPPSAPAARRPGCPAPQSVAAPADSRPHAAPQADRTPSARAGHAWQPLAPALWPDAWQQRLRQTRPGRIVWTYWNLGNDLSGVETPGRQQRSAFFQRLLQALHHPAGSHTFWPVCLPASGQPAQNGPAAPQPQADVFWSGLPRLGARGVVIMGSAAVDAVQLPGSLRPLQHTIYRGHRVWVLWDVDNMLSESQRYSQMLAMLRQALHPLIYR